MTMTADPDLELIDGLTFDEWMDMMPIGLDKMTEAEREAALLHIKARAAVIQNERAGKTWQEVVYGRKGEYYSAASFDGDLILEEPTASYGYTGTPEQDEILAESIAYVRAGGKLITKEELFAGMRAAIDSVKYGRA